MLGSSLTGSQEKRALLRKPPHFAAFYILNQVGSEGVYTSQVVALQLTKVNLSWRNTTPLGRKNANTGGGEVGKTSKLTVGVRMAGRLQCSCKWLTTEQFSFTSTESSSVIIQHRVCDRVNVH